MNLLRSAIALLDRALPGPSKLWLAAPVLAIALAGCGGCASGSSQPSAAPPPPRAAPAPRPPAPPPPPPVQPATPPPTTTAPAPPPTTAPAPPSTTAPAPTTTAPPPTTSEPEPEPEPGEGTTPGQGSAAAGTTVGTAQYAVPAGAIVVSTTGSDAAPGTATQPKRTLGNAISAAPTGGTIVLRGGVYHESVAFHKRVTIQNWPGEAVWLDGSVPLTDWVAAQGRWRYDGWTIEFDKSPTYTRGAGDNTRPGWGFVNPNHPMAAHPDQIWIDGVAQRQVGSLAEVGPGTFYHDEANDRLWLGSDPTHRSVRASALVRALMIRAEGATVRGIGIRRYAPSVPDMGSVTVERRNVTLEHVAITDAATTGLHVGSHEDARNVTFRDVHVARSGMLGISGSYADHLTLERVLSEDNNTERFNTAPVSGGAKIGRSRHVDVYDSIFRDNHGPGLWMDESVYDMTITGNEMRDNFRHGTSLEISAKALFANNFVTNNGGFGIKINNTAEVDVWNNTFTGNARSINLLQDGRRPGTSAGRDPRQPFPDPTMTWVNGPAVFVNNVIANQHSPGVSAGTCMFCVEDYQSENRLSAEEMGVTANSNVYNRPNTSSPSWLAIWSRGPGHPAGFANLSAFQQGTGQEASGHHTDGPALVDSQGAPTAHMPDPGNAQPLPPTIAQATGKSTGDRHLGAWPR